MNKLVKIFSFVSVIAIMIGCSDIEKSGDRNMVTDYGFLDSVSCDSCVHLLVLSTNISQQLKNSFAKEDGTSNDTMLIKIFHRNETQPGTFFEAADGFINVDLKKKKVYLVNIAEEKFEAIQFDKNILDHFISKCAAAKAAAVQ